MLLSIKRVYMSFPIALLAIVIVRLAAPFAAFATPGVEVVINSDPPLPRPVESELSEIFSGTLTEVLFEDGSIEDLLSVDSDVLVDSLIMGINIVIEPMGYTVAELDLDLGQETAYAAFLVHPAGWTEVDPRAVTDVDVVLSTLSLSDFWIDRLGGRMEENDAELAGVFGESLLGLPSSAGDEDWSLGLVMPGLIANSPAVRIFSEFSVVHSVTLGQTAVVTLELLPSGKVIELVRPRMYSRTLYNIILDRMRERLLAEARIIEGMPEAELIEAAGEIEEVLRTALENDPLARQFNAYASITINILQDEPVARIDARIESRSYDLGFETFVDIGNESSDSAEVQARFGYLFARGIEVFVLLNYFTNDSTLETDIALGLNPSTETFVAVGYDTERETFKYFFSQEIATGLRLRGELFEEDSRNEFGLTYQFQQYLSAGFYTNGDNEYWVRTIFTL